MTSVEATFMLTGDHFIPSELTDKLGHLFKITVCSSPQDDWGYARIEMEGFSFRRKEMRKMTEAQMEEHQYGSWRAFRALIEKVYEHHEIIRNAHVDDINVWCNMFDDGQCSMQFDAEDISRLGEMKASLSITCWSGYYEDED